MNWKEKPIYDSVSKGTLDATKKTYQLFNIWTKTTEGNTNNAYKGTVDGHDVVMLRLRKNE